MKTRTFAAQIGASLARARIAAGLSQRQVADRTGGMLTPNLISLYESGTEPRLSRFLAVCLAIGVHPIDVLPADLLHLTPEQIRETLCDP